MSENSDGTQYSLDAFVSDLLAAKGLGDDPDTHAELLEQVQNYINQAIIEALPGETKERLEYLVNGGDATEEEISDLIENADFNAELATKNAMESFSRMFLKGDEDGQ